MDKACIFQVINPVFQSLAFTENVFFQFRNIICYTNEVLMMCSLLSSLCNYEDIYLFMYSFSVILVVVMENVGFYPNKFNIKKI